MVQAGTRFTIRAAGQRYSCELKARRVDTEMRRASALNGPSSVSSLKRLEYL